MFMHECTIVFPHGFNIENNADSNKKNAWGTEENRNMIKTLACVHIGALKASIFSKNASSAGS